MYVVNTVAGIEPKVARSKKDAGKLVFSRRMV